MCKFILQVFVYRVRSWATRSLKRHKPGANVISKYHGSVNSLLLK